MIFWYFCAVYCFILILLCDSEAAQCLTDPVVHCHREEGHSVVLTACTIMTSQKKIHWRWIWIELIVALSPPNFFRFYLWTRLDYRESLDLVILGSICEDDNWQFRVVSAHAAFCANFRSRSHSCPVSRSLLFQLPITCFSYKYRIAGIIRGRLIFAVFAVDKHPRKLNPRIIRL